MASDHNQGGGRCGRAQSRRPPITKTWQVLLIDLASNEASGGFDQCRCDDVSKPARSI